MTKGNLVLIGGGHAHLTILAKLESFTDFGHRVTVIQPSPYHYYSGMGAGMLAGTYAPGDIRFHTQRVVEKKGGTFVEGRVARIVPEKNLVVLQEGTILPYDVLSCNAGSYVSLGKSIPPLEGVYYAKPIEDLLAARTRILDLAPGRDIKVGVVGGGPSAVEIAGNTRQLLRSIRVSNHHVVLFAGKGLLPRSPARVRRMALKSLTSRGMDVVVKDYVREIRPGEILTESGKGYPGLDIIFVASGLRPSAIFRESGLPTGPDGGLRVNRYLQCKGHPNIFGGGDCIYFEDKPLEKVGVYAVRQNPVLYHNLMACLESRELQPFDPGGRYLLILSLGEGRGIFQKWRLVFDGPLAFLIKTIIDRRFMKKFRAVEEN